jgi:hypothetical protein
MTAMYYVRAAGHYAPLIVTFKNAKGKDEIRDGTPFGSPFELILKEFT